MIEKLHENDMSHDMIVGHKINEIIERLNALEDHTHVTDDEAGVQTTGPYIGG